MKAAINTLGQVLYAPSQYVIPVFQRNYRWELPQWEKYWTSLIDIQQLGKVGNHFMGFLVFVQGGTAQPGQHTRFHLIDGQQRLTTTSLLLAAIRNVAKRTDQHELAKEIHDYFLVHPLKKGENRYRLLPKAQDAANFTAIIDEKVGAVGRTADAVAWFEAKVAELTKEDPEHLRALFDTVCQRLEFMCATLETENAYSIFKGLNSTGVPLGQSDLIRNFIFMHVHPDAQDEFDHDIWAPLEAQFKDDAGRIDEALLSRFFRDVLMSDGQYVQPTDTFSTFEARHEATGFAPAALGQQLLAWAGYYSVILGRSQDSASAITRALAELNKLESSTTTPLLLALFRRRAAKAIDDDGLALAIQMLRGFIFRRFIAGESSRGYGQMFVRAIDPQAAQPVEALEKYLLERGWPHDARFIEAFSLFPLYKRGYARELLETLEVARGHKELADLAATQIEHILPQTITDAWRTELGDEAERVHEEWLHRPGNLTLSAYNQELGNQPFTAKRARFKDSNVVLTREIADTERWTESEILARGLVMANAAAAIWIGPNALYVGQADAGEDDASTARAAFWSGFAAYVAKTHPELPSITPGDRRTLRIKTGVPKVLLDLRFKHSESLVALDLHFFDRATRCWKQFRQDSTAIDALIGATWLLDRSPSREYGWMTLQQAAPTRDRAHWPSLQAWLAQMWARVHQHLLPMLRMELQGDVSGAEVDSASSPSPLKLQQKRFWTEMSNALKQRSQTLRPQKPRPEHWTYLAIGRSGIVISPTLNTREDRLGVELSVGSVDSKKHYQALLAQRSEIEQEFGADLDWQELPDKHMCRIAIWRDASKFADESRWPEYVDWMIDQILNMESVFRARVGALE